MDNIDFNKCPIGIKNSEQIDSTRKVFEMAMQRLEEKVDDIKDDVNSGFKKVDERFNAMEDRFNNFESNLPNAIDDRIKSNTNSKAAGITKWVIVTLLGSVVITVVGKLVLTYLGLV